MKDELAFGKRADHAITTLYRLLVAASEDFGFDVDLSEGVLTVEFEKPPAKFVISPNDPARQIWVSARAQSHKLDWDIVQNAFVLISTDQTLTALVQEALSRQLGEEVEL